MEGVSFRISDSSWLGGAAEVLRGRIPNGRVLSVPRSTHIVVSSGKNYRSLLERKRKNRISFTAVRAWTTRILSVEGRVSNHNSVNKDALKVSVVTRTLMLQLVNPLHPC